MTSSLGFLSLLPPILAISATLITRNVYLSLIAGLLLGYGLLNQSFFGSFNATIEGSISVLASTGNAKVIVFILLIGGLMHTLQATGAFRGFVRWIDRSHAVATEKGAQWLAWVTGVVIFVESSITVLVGGAITQPLMDRFKVSRERLAYILDSTSAPICILIPMNAWGAFNLGLLDDIEDIEPLAVFVSAIPLNFYALTAVGLCALVIAFNWNIGPMKQAEARAKAKQAFAPTTSETPDPNTDNHSPARNMMLPLLALIAMMPVGLWITGDGDIFKGNGSTSIIWSISAALVVLWSLLLLQKRSTPHALTDLMMTGMGKLLPMATILLLSIAIGNLTKELGTAHYVVSLIPEGIGAGSITPIVFIIGAVVAFSIGSSWGTFALLIPIAIPMGVALGFPPELMLAAVLAGGVFGDHASPISDTSIISSLAAGVDHVAHVKTQLPYALLAAGLSVVCFTLAGLVMG